MAGRNQVGRRADLDLLDPEFRQLLEALVADLAAEGIPLEVYETVRGPGRQMDKLAKKKSKAGPYQSAHQYGLGADLVFKVDGKWTWAEPEAGQWDRFHELARKHGLKPLSFEKPHVQLASFDWRGMDRGPADDDGWLEWLAERHNPPLFSDGQAPVA